MKCVSADQAVQRHCFANKIFRGTVCVFESITSLGIMEVQQVSNRNRTSASGTKSITNNLCNCVDEHCVLDICFIVVFMVGHNRR